MQNSILVKLINVYGNDLVYPVCEMAKKFARLTNAKTLTMATISIIKSMGYTIEVEVPKL